MTAPQRLVQDGARRYGRFDGRVRDTNPVAAHRGLSRLWHEFRLKEWVGFALIDPEISGATADPLSTAHVRDRDHRLNVTFTPAGRKAVKANLVAAAIDYWQLAGTYRGTVTSLAGQSFSFDDVPGVLERMKTRF